MRRFELIRNEDVSGVSGTGVVADGVLFDDGLVALHWGGTNPTVTTHINGIGSVDTIHGHQGLTVVRWIDDEPITAVHASRVWAEGDVVQIGKYTATRGPVSWDCTCGALHWDGEINTDYSNGRLKIQGGGA